MGSVEPLLQMRSALVGLGMECIARWVRRVLATAALGVVAAGQPEATPMVRLLRLNKLAVWEVLRLAVQAVRLAEAY